MHPQPHKAAWATSLVVIASKSLASSKALEILKAPRAAPAKFTASGPSSKAAKFHEMNRKASPPRIIIHIIQFRETRKKI